MPVFKDALVSTKIDGFMMDWFYSPPYDKKALGEMRWMECERQMYEEFFGEPFPGKENITAEKELQFHRAAISRCWKRIKKTIDETRTCTVWLSCCSPLDPQIKGLDLLEEVDWLMNENNDPNQILAVRELVPESTKLIQCLAGWGPRHDAKSMIESLANKNIGFYGFARPDVETTLPPTVSDDPHLAGNATNIAVMKKAFSSDK